MRTGSAAVLLAALAAVAFLAGRWYVIAAIVAGLLVVCLRAPARRRWPYLVGTGISSLGVFLLTPFVGNYGEHEVWSGPIVPVLGRLDITSEELTGGAVQALRLAAVGLAFAAYALLLDHDRLLQAARFARRSLRGRGVAVAGVRGHARLLSPLLAGSLERGYSLAEAMEARGYGHPGATRAPRPTWRWPDWCALAVATALVVGGLLWL